jgi:hypothetical protein
LVAPHFTVSFWRTGLLAIVAAALGAYIYWIERPRIADESAPDYLLKFDVSEIAAATLRYPDDEEIELVRNDAGWSIRRPLEFRADSTTVERLLAQVAETTTERHIKIADAEPLATYGLEGNGTQARLSLRKRDGEALPDIVVGRTTPVGYNAFARVEGRDEISLVPLLLHTGIRKSVFDFRDKQLFDVDTAHVTGMWIDIGSRQVRLERRGDSWEITAPVRTRADPDQALSLAAALNSLQALEFYEDPVVDGDGTDAPSLAFRVQVGDEPAPVGFRLGRSVGQPGTGVYLRRDGDGLVVKVDESVHGRFGKDLSDLRDKRLFHCDADDMARVSFERADGTAFALVRASDGWTLDPPPREGESVRTNVAQRSVAGLATLAGNEVVADGAAIAERLATFGLDVPRVEVEIEARDGRSCGRAIAGAVAGGSETTAYFVRRAEDDLLMTLPSYLFSRLDLHREDLLAPSRSD